MKQDTGIQSLQLRQTWVEDETENIKEIYDFKSKDSAFQSLAFSLLFDVGYEDIRPEEIVDGSQDKQIDIIRIEDDIDNSQANIHIIQIKNENGFKSTIATQMKNGLDWIFGKSKEDVEKLENKRFKEKIKEIRDIKRRYYPTNLSVYVYYVTRGDANRLSSEYYQEKKTITDVYGTEQFKKFEYREYGANELYEIMMGAQKNKRNIDVEIPIVYDKNTRSLIEFSANGSKALICTITGEVLSNMASTKPQDAIFDLNVRQYMGHRGRVNSDIRLSCTSDSSTDFWFLNNGVTMTCDTFEFNADSDLPMVRVKNAQIVNGCQTSVTIREAQENNELKNDVKLLLRIYATDNSNLIEKITLTTNNQNKITERDLRANDAFQQDVQFMMKKKYGLNYERKNREFRNDSRIDKSTIIPNDKSAQAYLAIVNRKPSAARGYLAKVWSDYYNDIFNHATVDDLVYAYNIYKYALKSGEDWSDNINVAPEVRENVIYGAFHIARIIGFILRQNKWGKLHSSDLSIQNLRLIKKHTIPEIEFLDVYTRSVEIITAIRMSMPELSPSPALFFKNNLVDNKIEGYLDKMPNID